MSRSKESTTSIVTTSLVGAAGIAAAFVVGPGLAFLVFGTAFLQSFGSSMKLQGEIDSEIARQQGICDQIKFSQDQLDKMNTAVEILNSSTYDETQLEAQIGDMSDSINSEINKLKSMQSSFKKNFLINIIIYIVVVAFLSLIIISKKN